MLILIISASIGQCHVPREAYIMDRDLTEHEFIQMNKFGYCVCGPEGTVDWDPRPHKHGGDFAHPSCNRDQWDNRHNRYRRH